MADRYKIWTFHEYIDRDKDCFDGTYIYRYHSIGDLGYFITEKEVTRDFYILYLNLDESKMPECGQLNIKYKNKDYPSYWNF